MATLPPCAPQPCQDKLNRWYASMRNADAVLAPSLIGRAATAAHRQLSAFSLSSCGRAGLRNVRSLDCVVWRKPGRLLSRLLTGASPAHRTYLACGNNVTMADLVEVVRSIVPRARIPFPTPPT